MLTLNKVRLAPTMVSTTTTRWKNVCAPMIIAPLSDTSNTTSATITTSATMWRETHLRAQVHRNFISSAPVALTFTRFYSNQNPTKTPPTPSPPKLPDKEQMQRIFFRVLAFVWDISLWMFLLARKTFREYVLENKSVKMYWNKLHEKMEEAKKN